jgi:hypothetical protein
MDRTINLGRPPQLERARQWEVDHLRILWKVGFVLDATGYDGEVSRFNCSLLGTDPQSDRVFNYPNKLLLRMLVSGSVGTRLNSPIDHRALFAGYDAAANLVERGASSSKYPDG